ncbi:hypothetical protein LOTGIDRAFT_235609 [Lottia gigantea]|uniref:Threonine-rich protein n=2 Tax=Lottia gigantea TaxID=225164 RepID=TRP_LOTGI|nr:hypothetical protein LOTGIDRAFT_235609 [Lottia gigantea]B3A0R4.1 RecName: Full=Threonine-rich protein; AltName: Full=Uncharacterized shell protein 15; Short=LUSP-15; Flags: Precursor [Lottia gigantea]ESO86011.1 hypothetical protein LOTGIDRAFT_235609 [Lottia gigantea]
MKGLTLACIAATVVAASHAMTTIIAPIAEISTTSSPSTTTINPLLQSRIDFEISRLTRRLERRIRGLQVGSGRLDRSITSLQRELDFNNAVLAQLPELIKNIMINNPTQRLSSRTVASIMRSVQNAATKASNEESAEVEDRRRRAIFEVTSSIVIVEGTTDSTTTTQIPEVTTQEVDTTTEMVTTAAPEQEVTSTATETTTEMTTQGTTLPSFLVSRINSVVSRIGRFFQRRIQRIQRSLSRLSRFRPLYSRLIDENTSALNNLPLLVRGLVTSPFQRRLRLSQVFRALRFRLTITTPSQPDVSPMSVRKRRQAESAEEDDDLVGDMEDLKELEQEIQEALEEVEKLDV